MINNNSFSFDITEHRPTMIFHMPATRLTMIFNVISKFQFLLFNVQNDIITSTLLLGLIDQPILPSNFLYFIDVQF